MTNSDTSILLRSLAKLIEKPEIKAFQSSLTKTMNSIIVADSIMLYEIRMLKQVASECAESFLVPVGCEDALVEDQAAPTLLSQQPQFEEALRTTAVVTRQVGDAASPVVRSIYPIHGARGVTGFLAVDTKTQVRREQQLISIFLAEAIVERFRHAAETH